MQESDSEEGCYVHHRTERGEADGGLQEEGVGMWLKLGRGVYQRKCGSWLGKEDELLQAQWKVWAGTVRHAFD